MQKYFWWRSWPRFLLWSHVIGVVGFYLLLWLRTRPDKQDRVAVLPQKQPAKVPASQEEQPLVSIIVPARDEERNIGRCIQSLLEQDYDNYEVIVVNDGSTDQTEDVLDELARTHPQGQRLWILHLREELPEGWAGKPHALHCGVQEARGSWLLFTDADTWHAPNALRSTLKQALAEQVDCLTISSTQELPTFWERTLMPIAYMGISMLYPPRQVNDPASAVAVASGQYILLRREAYDLVGGYTRPELRTTLLDDRDLAYVLKEHGFKLRLVDGCDLVYARMYDSLPALWRGWRKNAYLGNRGGLPFVLLELWGLPMISVVPFLLPWYPKLLRGRSPRRIGQAEANTAALLEVSALLAYRSWLNGYMRVPWYYGLTQPLGGVAFMGILGQSAWRILTGKGVDWKGRQYHTEKK